MQFFAAKGLATPIDDVWKTLTPQMPPSFKAASTGADGHQYFVPNKNYPWAVYYRKSLWKEKGYTVPTTWDQFIALAKKMQADGLTPIAFTDKDGWPPMGTFDILNMRINGYKFHVDLMAGKQAWDGPQVRAVFKKWTELFPYYSQGIVGLTWQDGAAAAREQAGRHVLPRRVPHRGDAAGEREGHRLLPVPVDQPEVGAGLDRRPDRRLHDLEEPEEPDGAKKLVEFLGTAPAINVYIQINSGNLAVEHAREHASYSPLQKKEATLIAATKNIAQYMDRDTRPDFASTVMIPSLQSFVNKPGTTSSSRRASRSRRRRSSDRELVHSARWRPTSQRARERTARGNGSAPSVSPPATVLRSRSWSGSP